MIKFFSKGVFSTYVWMNLLILLCWLPSFFHPADFVGFTGSIIPAIQFKGITQPLTINILSFFGYVFSVFFLNYMAVKQQITGLISMLPVLFYVLFTGSAPNFTTANIFIWISLLLMVVLYYSMTLYERENSVKNAFNAGFFLGTASLFYTPLIYLTLVIWISVLLHRVNSWRPYVSSVMGLLSPFLLWVTWLFISNQMEVITQVFIPGLIPQISLTDKLQATDIWLFGLLVLFGLAVSFNTLSKLGEKSINLRRNLLLFVILFGFLLAITILFFKSLQVFMLAGIPVALMAAQIFTKSKPNKWINRLIVLMTLFVVFTHVYRLLYAS